VLRKIVVIFSFFYIVPGFAQGSSSIDFVIKNLGINVDGSFNQFSISAKFNSEGALEHISSQIKVASITTGIESRDEHILEEDYFNAQKHEFITLKSTAINRLVDKSYTVDANLTIKGITKRVQVPVEVKKLSGGYEIKSNFEINRRDFDVGGGGFVMGKIVKIRVDHYQEL
jgi:polyisoprenoid-binding protein YceI